MRCRQRFYDLGDLVKVKHCFGGYRLPDGLPEGSTVKVLEKQTGYISVEYNGTPFLVALACIHSGWEYELNEIWYDQNAPAIQHKLKKEWIELPAIQTPATIFVVQT